MGRKHKQTLGLCFEQHVKTLGCLSAWGTLHNQGTTLDVFTCDFIVYVFILGDCQNSWNPFTPVRGKARDLTGCISMPALSFNLKRKTLVCQPHFIELFCLAVFCSGCNNALGRCLRKYWIIVLLKAVETTNLLQQMKVEAMKALVRRCYRCFYCRECVSSGVIVVCSLIGFINVLNAVVCCSMCQGSNVFTWLFFKAIMQPVAQTLIISSLRTERTLFYPLTVFIR